MVDLNKLINDAQVAIEFWEDIDAKKILKQLRTFIVENKIDQTDPALLAKLQKWMVYLQLVAFPSLSDQECGEILRNHYLESFRINVPMENRIMGKLFLFPYLARDEVREILKRGLAGNVQNLGRQTIGQWVQEFEQEFNIYSRTESAPVQFVRENLKARTLSQTEQHILKETLHIYDYLLVSNLPAEGEDLQNLMKSGVLENESGFYDQQTFAPQVANIRQSNVFVPNPNFQNRNQRNVPAQPLLEMTLAQALKNFPNLGEESVTINPLKLRYFKNSVRPSIRNWITDYHDALGASKHSAIERGNFLFQSENGKKLTPMERQKISMLLKSLDEETLLQIDGNAQKVFFDLTTESSRREMSAKVELVEKEKPTFSQQVVDSPAVDVAGARIRQALNFTKNVPTSSEQPFAYEEGNYADTFQQTTQEKSKKTPDNLMKNNLGENQQTQFGSLHFSSAQELPVEKNKVASKPEPALLMEKKAPNFQQVATPANNFNKPENQTKQEAKLVVENVKSWNSPNFKNHLPSTEPIDIMQRDFSRPLQTSNISPAFSPYTFDDSDKIINNDKQSSPDSKEPKIQGNVVDLR
ncbi:MAG: hypothetical protein WCJ51_00165 [Candidatus Moraniibacteriota bacterium]